MDSLTSEMAVLEVQGDKPKKGNGGAEIASLSTSSSSDRSKTSPLSVQDDTTDESSQDETSAE
jgi:hypothetical protein